MEEFEQMVEALKEKAFNPGELLLMDERRLRLTCAWPSVPKEIVPPDENRDNPWAWVKFDLDDWALYAQVQVFCWADTFTRLVNARLIFPDGTIPDEVTRYITRRVEAGLGVDPDEETIFPPRRLQHSASAR